jgi:type IV pilus assembly protein PilC
MEASRDDSPAPHDHRAHRRVRAGQAEPAPGFAQRGAHESFVVHASGLSLAVGSLNPELRAVSLRFREKQSLYHSLGQLLRSGVTFPAALQQLAPSSRGSLRRLLGQLNRSIESGSTVAEAFAAQRPGVSEMEAGIVAAVERAGRLDRGLMQLATYFGALEAARSTALKRAAYPIFVLHFGILALGVKTLVTQGVGPYVREVGSLLLLVYGIALVIALAVPLLSDAGATSRVMDALLRSIPLIGSIRRNFAVFRFCSTYEMQLGAGVNVMDSLKAAGRASRSGLIATTVARALPEVVKGDQVGPLLSRGSAFPESMLRDLTVAEQTGRLDEELDRLAEEHQRAALSSLDLLAEWVPRLIYLGVVAYVGFRIVSFYAGYMKTIEDLTKDL